MKGMKKALSLLMTLSMVAGLFTAVPPSVVSAEEGVDNSEAGIVVDFPEDMSISDNSTYLMAADWFEWDEQGPASLGMDEDGNHHYMNKWFVSYGETHPVKLALVTAHAVEGTEDEPQWEWSLAGESEVSMNSICVKDSEGNVIDIENSDDVIYGTWGSFCPDNEMEKDNEKDAFLFLKEGSYWISYTKDAVEYKLPVETVAPELGFYSADSITADNMLRGEKTYTDESSKAFFAGLSLDSNEVAGYRILMEMEEGKEEWEYSYCEVEGERKDINEFLTIGEKEGDITSEKEQVMIPFAVKKYVPADFWINLAVELTYKDENRSPEVRTCGIQVTNAGNKLLMTDWIDWAEDGQVSVAEGAEYFNDWMPGLDDQIWVAFQLSNHGETTVKADDLALFDEEGNRLEVAVIERDEEETEENTKDKAAIMRKGNAEGNIIGMKFLRMGNFYLQYQEAGLSVQVGLPELGLYTSNEFSEETYAWSQYELRSDAPEKALYVRLQTGDWHNEIKDTDVKLSVYRDWEHRFNVKYPEPDAETERPLLYSDYIVGGPVEIASGENVLAYKITFKDKVPDSFLLEVEVERTNKDNNEDASLGRLIEVKYVQIPAKLTGIRITKQPLKTTYTVGETFDKTGMVVTADYDDGTTKVITDYVVNPSGSFTAGDKSVTISYEGKSAVLNITVKEKAPEKVPEEKPAKQKGADIEQASTKYTVTDAKADGTGTVAYAGTADKKAKTIKIPAVITDSETGVSYKVTSIKKNAFKNSKALTGVTIGSNVTKIEEGAFSSCKKLKKITIPGSVTSIGKNAFKNCSALTTVTIGKKVTSIGGSAFSGCKKLKSITIKSSVLKTVGSNAFKGINSKATIKVPKKKKSAYKKLIINKGKAPKKVKIK